MFCEIRAVYYICKCGSSVAWFYYLFNDFKRLNFLDVLTYLNCVYIDHSLLKILLQYFRNYIFMVEIGIKSSSKKPQMLQSPTSSSQSYRYLQHVPNYHVDKISLNTRNSWHFEINQTTDLSYFVLKKCKSKAIMFILVFFCRQHI